MSSNTIKIFVTGFFNSGKSTLVHSFDSKAIHVEKKLKKVHNNEKTHTTTGFDLGRLVWARPNLNPETNGVVMSKSEFLRDKNEYVGWHLANIELKGCPGQMQFTSVRKILAKGNDGVIFLIDGCDLANIGNALVVLEETKAILGTNIPMRIIANKSDRDDYHGCEMISNMVGEKAFEGSGKFKVGVKDALIEILKGIENGSYTEHLSEKGVVVQNG